MSNIQQRNGDGSKNDNQPQTNPSFPPMVRATIPSHIHHQLLPATPSLLSPFAPSHTTQQTQARFSFQRPTPNYQNAFAAMDRTIREQYSQPSASQIQYAQRQTYLAEYGHLPPDITPPSTPGMAASLLRMQGPVQHLSDMGEKPTRPQSGLERSPSDPGRRVVTPVLQQRFQQRVLTATERVEILAFRVDGRTELNEFGGPRGYIPANYVDQMDGALDGEGRMMWVPTWEK